MVSVISNNMFNMTQAQIDLRNRPVQNTADLITQPLFNYSLDLFLEAMDQDQPFTNSDQLEHRNISPKDQTPPEITNEDTSRETPPPQQKKYEIMKDPAFLSLPIYPPILPSKLRIEMIL